MGGPRPNQAPCDYAPGVSAQYRAESLYIYYLRVYIFEYRGI